jgi:hypothetical protein
MRQMRTQHEQMFIHENANPRNLCELRLGPGASHGCFQKARASAVRRAQSLLYSRKAARSL